MKNVKKAVELEADYIELRLDVIEDITSALAADIIESVKEITDTPIILTNRAREEGGFFRGSREQRVKILSDNAHLVEYADIELSTGNALIQKILDNANNAILSYHNFEKTPSQDFLQDMINKAHDLGAIPKVAVRPLSMEDTYVILNLLMENNDIIAISMDKMGSFTRVIGPVLGSPVTYASLDLESAPGQLDVKTTKDMINKLKC